MRTSNFPQIVVPKAVEDVVKSPRFRTAVDQIGVNPELVLEHGVGDSRARKEL